jgi:hypothetical protein
MLLIIKFRDYLFHVSDNVKNRGLVKDIPNHDFHLQMIKIEHLQLLYIYCFMKSS